MAGPRARHGESGLDLCYVTDFIIATSGPSSVYPKKAYRNPTDQLVKYLDYKHDTEWSIWEFRAEGTGYPDSEVHGRIHHFPWPDHHPPPFALIPNIMASMRQWLRHEDEEGNKHKKKRVAVVHCKAGKGRSGSIAVSYLISQEGWTKEEALERFTERRMRVGFGQGVSIPSQLRWIGYVDRWANQLGKKYIERPVEILEIRVFGLRDGVKVAVEGYVEEGRRMQSFHIFTRKEKTIIDGRISGSGSDSSKKSLDKPSEPILTSPKVQSPSDSTTSFTSAPTPPQSITPSSTDSSKTPTPGTQNVLLHPSSPIVVPTSDINIDFERRNKAAYTGFTLVTSVAHVWFNAYFEGGSDRLDSSTFEISWEALDGIKGSSKKGTKALDHVKVLWRYAPSPAEPGPEGERRLGRVITEPGPHEPVPEGKPTDWRGPQTDEEKSQTDPSGDNTHSSLTASLDRTSATPSSTVAGAYLAAGAQTLGKELGLRKDRPESVGAVSRASSMRDLKSHTPVPDETDNPYPSDNDTHLQTTTTSSSGAGGIPTRDDSVSASNFGKGMKSAEIKDAEKEIADEEAQGAAKPTHAPAEKNDDDEALRTQSDDNSSPASQGPSKVVDLGLGNMGQVVERFKESGGGGGGGQK